MQLHQSHCFGELKRKFFVDVFAPAVGHFHESRSDTAALRLSGSPRPPSFLFSKTVLHAKSQIKKRKKRTETDTQIGVETKQKVSPPLRIYTCVSIIMNNVDSS